MNKNDLVTKVATKAKLTKKDVENGLSVILDTIMDAVKKGDKVGLVGFGTFSQAKRAARKGRNPQTGKEITIPARKSPKFTAGKLFKEKVK